MLTRQSLTNNAIILFAASFVSSQFAYASSIVVPPIIGPGNSEGRPGTAPLRVQYLYPATYFDSLDTLMILNSVSFRPDEKIEMIEAFADSFSLRLSTTEVEELSVEFAENVGDDLMTVFESELSISTIGEEIPRRFDITIPFEQPFPYDHQKGNLLVEMTIAGLDVGDWAVDNHSLDNGFTHLIEAVGDDMAEFATGSYSALAVLEFQFDLGNRGDCNRDGSLDVDDIDHLTQGILGDPKSTCDLNGDGLTDESDHKDLITGEQFLHTWIGDANLDREFNSGDLVRVFQSGKNETDIRASWSEGDWNADGHFNSTDLVMAFQDGGYELGPRTAVATVPEPEATMLMALGVIGFGYIRKTNVRFW